MIRTSPVSGVVGDDLEALRVLYAVLGGHARSLLTTEPPAIDPATDGATVSSASPSGGKPGGKSSHVPRLSIEIGVFMVKQNGDYSIPEVDRA